MSEERLEVTDKLNVTNQQGVDTVSVELNLREMKLIDVIDYQIERLESMLRQLRRQRDKLTAPS